MTARPLTHNERMLRIDARVCRMTQTYPGMMDSIDAAVAGVNTDLVMAALGLPYSYTIDDVAAWIPWRAEYEAALESAEIGTL